MVINNNFQDRQIRQYFGIRVKQIRKANGLTQCELGQVSGLHKNYIGKIERGEVAVNLRTLFTLATALSVDARQLIDFDSINIKEKRRFTICKDKPARRQKSVYNQQMAVQQD